MVNGRSVSKFNDVLERHYKDKSNEWKSSNSFGRNEIPLVKWCLGKAFDVMPAQWSVNGVGEGTVR